MLLGVDGDGRAVFAADAGRRASPASGVGLRELAPALRQADGGLVAHAVALLNWHRRHRFCANCGAASETPRGGAHARVPALRRPSTTRAPTPW